MKLLPRRNTDPVGDVPVEPESDLPSGKGRPTPKRRDTTGPRGPVTAPKTRKEAYARQKQQQKELRTARSTARRTGTPMTAAQRRDALRAGDPSVLPRRDQGPTRKLARDFVDSHRLFSNYLLLLFPIMIVSYAIPMLQILILLTFVALMLEWNFIGRRIRKLAMERFGEADGGNMSIGFYAGSRAYLPRRWRLPAPQVSRGDAI
ncbi:MAG TPA: DUF3043 domain-containing protein [Jatrophihabitantaceae bacterium]|nr:DUF3043 domain-containing protein [Jatrophihabitantaceae bacterium]